MIIKFMQYTLSVFTLLFVISCASPKKYDIPKKATTLEATHGIVIGKMEALGIGGAPSAWNPMWQKMSGVKIKTEFIHNNIKSSYGIDEYGYFALKFPEGKIEDLSFTAVMTAQNNASNRSASARVGGGTLTVSGASSFTSGEQYTIASKDKPLIIKAGKILILPVHMFNMMTKPWAISVDNSGGREADIINKFKEKFPELAKQYLDK